MTETERLAALYRETILTHAARPCGLDAPITCTHRASRNNPLCGDDIEIRLQLGEGRIEAVAFSGEACAICLASASLLCGELPGRAVDELALLDSGFRAALAGNAQDCPPFLVPMLGVRQYPARIACATLPWSAALAALSSPWHYE